VYEEYCQGYKECSPLCVTFGICCNIESPVLEHSVGMKVRGT